MTRRSPLTPNTHRNRDNWPEAEESSGTFWAVFRWFMAALIAGLCVAVLLVKR